MADMYRYGNVKLAHVPSMPDGCSYGIIFYDEEDTYYYWFCSSDAFFLDGTNYMIPATATYGGNAAKEGASYWNSAKFTPVESEAAPDYYIVANTENIIWSNVDICQRDSDTVAFHTTKPLQYPTISFSGSSRLYCIGAEASALVCDAEVNDGGALSWAWYDGETVVGTSNIFTPPTDTVCEKDYYCVVTNTTEGETLTTTSRSVTIRVKEFFPIQEYIGWLLAGLMHPLPMLKQVVTSWNIKDFSASTVTYRDATNASNVITEKEEYTIGEAPLIYESQLVHISPSSTAAYKVSNTPVFYLPNVIPVGSMVILEVIWPEFDVSISGYGAVDRSAWLSSPEAFTSSCIRYKDNTLSIGGMKSSINTSTAKTSVIINSEGDVIGARLIAITKAEINEIQITSACTDWEQSTYLNATAKSVFSSYNDVRLTVITRVE